MVAGNATVHSAALRTFIYHKSLQRVAGGDSAAESLAGQPLSARAAVMGGLSERGFGEN